MFLIVLVLEYLILGWWCCLKRLRRCGLAGGGMSLKVSVKFSQLKELPPLLVCSSFFMLVAEMGILSSWHPALATMPCLPTMMTSYLSGIISPNKLRFCNLPWSWHFVTAAASKSRHQRCMNMLFYKIKFKNKYRIIWNSLVCRVKYYSYNL